MNLSSADWIQLGTSVVFIVASIASILVFAVKVHMPNWALAIIGVACFGIVAFIFLRNPSISTLTIMGGVATAIGILVGGASWVVNHGSDKFVAVLVSVLALGLMVTIVFHFTQPAPGPLPIPTPNLPFTSSATATTIAPATTSTGTSASTGPNGSTNPPGKSPTPTPRGSGHGPTSTATPGSGPVATATPGSGPTPTPTPTPQPTATPTPKPTPVFVQNASASNFSATPNGCFPTVQVSGTIFTNGGQGTISYYWGRSDGSSSASQTVGAVTGQSSYNVSDTWVPQVNSSPSTYWDELFVTGPNGVNSNQASGTLSC